MNNARKPPEESRAETTDTPHDMDRRTFVRTTLAGALGGTILSGAGLGSGCSSVRKTFAAQEDAPPFGMPGPFPGRVVEVRHLGSIKGNELVQEPVGDMVDQGMQDLVGAPDATQGWRYFFEPGDVVGIKVNPVGAPHAISSHELVHEVVAGLESAGVARKDIIVFERFRRQFLAAGYKKHLPDGVRWEASSEDYDPVQLDIEGYDPDVYYEMDLVAHGHHDPSDPRTRRSHLSLVVSRKVQKIVNLPVLKDHCSAGVTMALKNMSHGFVNNVNRSHATHSANACNTFIPAICTLPQIRSKVVLHIMDGLRGMFDGGPGGSRKTVWDYHTLFFSTDPVAMDRIGWEIVDGKRLERGLPVVAEARWKPPQNDEERRTHSFRQPEHIELAAALGLGVFHRDKIDLRKLDLTPG